MTDTVCRICGREPEPCNLLGHVMDYGHRVMPAAPRPTEEHDDIRADPNWNESDYDAGWGE